MVRDFPASSTGYLNVGDVAPIDITGTALTVFAWIYADTATGSGNIIAKADFGTGNTQYQLSQSSNKILFTIGDATGVESVTSTQSYGANTWWPVFGVKAGTGAGAIKVGVGPSTAMTTATSNKSIANTAQPLTIGLLSNLASNGFNGKLAEIAIWNAALTQAELSALSIGTSPLTVRPGNLKGYWPLQGLGAPELDYSPSRIHATVVGTIPTLDMVRPKLQAFTFDDLDYQEAPGLVGDFATVRLRGTPRGVEYIPKPNNNFANATVLSPAGGSLTAQSTADSDSQAGEPATSFFGGPIDLQSVWYSFTPTVTGNYRIKLSNILGAAPAGGFAPSTEINVYTGSSVGALTEVWKKFLTTSYGTPSSMGNVLPLTSGVTYHIRVVAPIYAGDVWNGRVSTFDVSWLQLVAPGPPPSNDNLASPTNLGTDPADGSHSGTTIGATYEGWELSPGGYDQPSVWYRFHCATNETQELHVVSSGANPDYRPYWEVYQITTDPPADYTDLNFIDSSDDPGLTGDGGGTVNLVAGNDYIIYVGNWDFNGEWDNFFLSFGPFFPPAPPGNDIWADVWTDSAPDYLLYASLEWGLTYSTYPHAGYRDGTTESATAESGESSRAGFPATRSVWYQFDPDPALPGDVGTYRFWVESTVDCVLAIYNADGPTMADLSLIIADDDSGAGNWPQIDFDITTGTTGTYAIAVDSKTEGTFTLKYQLLPVATPPSNDNWANAEVHTGGVWSTSGTTVGATAEIYEKNAEKFFYGPKDTVWYKWTPNFTGDVKAWIHCTSVLDSGIMYLDVWKGSSLATLTRVPEPPRAQPIGLSLYGDTVAADRAVAVAFSVVSGQDYYLRVQTTVGGSETFDITTEINAVYLTLKPSGLDVGPYTDAATVNLTLRPSAAVEEFHGTIIDAATVPVDLVAAGVEFKAFAYVDAGTVLLDMIAITEHECIFHLEPSWIFGGIRKWAWNGSSRRWGLDDTQRRWAWVEGEGQPQIC